MDNTVSQPTQVEANVTLRRLELEHQVAQRGLVGILTASVLGLLIVGVIVILAMLLPIYVEQGAVQLSGSELVQIIIALLVSIAGNVFMYGAFVYRRIAKLEADLATGKGGAIVS